MKRLTALLAVAALGVAGCNWGNSRQAKRADPPVLANEKFELVKEPPITAETRFAAGQLAETRNDWERAIEQYEASLALKPNQPETLNRLGVAFAMTQQYDKAITVTRRYVEVTNGSAQAYNNLAQCYEFANLPVDAEAAYRNGIESDPKSLICRTNFGLMLLRLGRVDEGCQQMSAVLPPAEVHYNVASILELQDRKPEARLEYQKALKADPNLIDARKRLAQLDTN